MRITLCVDKQERNNPSSELRKYSIDIGCPLRSLDEVYDKLNISIDDTTNKLVGSILRRCYVDKYGVLKKLDSEEIQELEIPDITLFEGVNYVYIQEFTNLSMKIEYLTNAEMNKYFATKAEMNSSIKQTYDSILLTVSTKADKTELQTAISLLTDEIDLRVIKDKIISAINMSPETITILANKLGLTANDVLDIIAGNEINMTAKKISFVADNYSVDKDGNLIANSATLNNAIINGGSIRLDSTGSASYSNAKLLIEQSESEYAYFSNEQLFLKSNDSYVMVDCTDGTQRILLDDGVSNSASVSNFGIQYATDNNVCFWVNYDRKTYIENCEYDSMSQRSLASLKRDIKKLDINCLNLIKNGDIYEFGYIKEDKTNKKHLGFVIGKNYKTPKEILSNSEKSIDYNSVSAILWKSIQELQEKIDNLEQQIKEMR